MNTALDKTYPSHENSDYTPDTTYFVFPTVYTHTHTHTDAGGSAVLRRRSVATHLLRLQVRIPLGACMSVPCACCLLSGRGFCVGPITCPEDSYRVWCA